MAPPQRAKSYSPLPTEKHFSNMSVPKLKILLKKIVVFFASLITGVIFIKVVGDYYAKQVDGYRRGNLYRLRSIICLEWIMAHASVPIYLHLFSVFSAPFNSPKYLLRCKNERVRLYCLLLFGFVVGMAHVTYLFYLAESFEIPWLLYDVSAICNGVWINCLVLCLAFTCYNLALRAVCAFAWGQRIVEQLFRIRPFKFVSTSAKFQVTFTLALTVLLSLTHWYASDKLIVRNEKIHIQRPTTGTKETLKVAILTDLHAGASVYGRQIAHVVERVNELDDVDAVFLIGDIIDAPRELIEQRVESLRHLRSRLGTFFVTGNHEYYYGNVDEWFNLFDSYGIHVLKNSAVQLKGHCVIGLNDIFSENSGLEHHFMDVKSISQCPRNQTTVVLEHNPAGVKQIVEYARNSSHPVDLILSGHTHNAQYFVLMPFAYLLLPYLYGLYSLNAGATQLLVSAGTLFQNAPMKTPFMSEIWLLDIEPNAN